MYIYTHIYIYRYIHTLDWTRSPGKSGSSPHEVYSIAKYSRAWYSIAYHSIFWCSRAYYGRFLDSTVSESSRPEMNQALGFTSRAQGCCTGVNSELPSTWSDVGFTLSQLTAKRGLLVRILDSSVGFRV